MSDKKEETFRDNCAKFLSNFGKLADGWVLGRWGALENKQKDLMVDKFYEYGELLSRRAELDEEIEKLSRERSSLIPRITYLQAKSYEILAGPSDWYVYFILCRETGRVKIGKAKDPHKRIKALQTASPGELSILLVLPESEEISESGLHRQFSESRVNGEWFSPTEDIDTFLTAFGGVPVSTCWSDGGFDEEVFSVWSGDANNASVEGRTN